MNTSLTGSLTREPAAKVRGIANDNRNDLDELIEPLVTLCQRRHLVGVTNETRLAEALQTYTAGEIRNAIRLICRRIETGEVIRSPIGLLVRLAEGHDRTHFSDDTAPAGRSVASETRDEPILAWPEELTADLDAEIDTDLARLPSRIAERLRTPPSRASLRAETYHRRISP